MAIAVIVAAVAATLLAIVVLGPVLGGTDIGGDEAALPGVVAAAFDPPAATATPAEQGPSPQPTATATAPWSPSSGLAASSRTSTPGARYVVSVPATPPPTERAAPRATRTPEPSSTATAAPSPSVTATPTPTPEPDVMPYYLAATAAELRAWSGPSWGADGAMLSSDGSAVLAQPWVSGPVTPPVRGGYAVEAEFRIDGLAPGYCKQSVGFIVPLSSGAFAGAGLIYECDASGNLTGSRARISDVSDYSNGYFQDPELAAKPVNLESGWHTLRLEVDGDAVRLLIDGDLVVSTPVGGSVARNPENALGLWSEGVKVSVRRIAVVALETA